MSDDIDKRIQNIFRLLQKDSRSVFYASTNTSNNLLKKLRKSPYEKDIVFKEFYEKLQNKDILKESDQIPLTTPFLEQKKDVDRSTLFSIQGPFELCHADIADLRFLAKSAVDLKYALLIVYLFTSKVYVYPMKNRSLLAKKLKLFYDEIDQKRSGKMRLQTDLEFNQNIIKKLNKEHNVEMFHTKIRGGKVFVAEQKIGKFKQILNQSKRLVKRGGKRLKPNELIKKAVENMNETLSQKYDVAPETIESNSLKSEYFKRMLDFQRIKKVEETNRRQEKFAIKKDRRRRKLRSPLKIGEKVIILAERIKKKDAPSKFYKASTDNIPFFNRENIYTVYKKVNNNRGTFYYWLLDDKQQKVNGRFLRQELFALDNHLKNESCFYLPK